jgi:hypothetical protein
VRFKRNDHALREYVPKRWRLDRQRGKYWWVIWVQEPGAGWVHSDPGEDYREYLTKTEAKARCDELNAWWQENGRVHAMLRNHTELQA